MTQRPEEPKVVPEFACTHLDRSRRFYVDVLGFEVLWERPEERFVYMNREGAHLMLEETDVAELELPLGRGMHLQIEVSNVEALLAAVTDAGVPLERGLEDKWYRANDVLLGNRQFRVRDPDGYLLRFFEHLGGRPVPSTSGNSVETPPEG